MGAIIKLTGLSFSEIADVIQWGSFLADPSNKTVLSCCIVSIVLLLYKNKEAIRRYIIQ